MAAPPRNVRTSAPGKAFLVGDLVALDGVPAAVMAVDRRVRVSLEPRPGEIWEERFVGEAGARRRARGVLLAAPGQGDLLAAVAQELAGRGAALVEGLSITSDRRALVDGARRPLGLGSSAAAAVALTAALVPKWRPEAIRRAAIAAHRRFQGGLGSGYDVACAFAGGMVLAQPAEGDVRTTPSALPPGLDAMLVGAGEPVSTRRVATALTALSIRPPGWRELVLATADALHALDARDSAALLEAVRAVLRAQEAVGRSTGLPLVSPRVRGLADRIEAMGGACKPSGAGGDELVVLFVPEADLVAAREAAREAGLPPRGATLDPRGLWIGGR